MRIAGPFQPLPEFALMMSPDVRMNRAMQYLFASGIVLSVICIASEASGYPAPTFSVEDAAPRATHIVVATEGDEIDGQLTVIDSWKGDLKTNEVILVPEMKAWSPVDARKALGAYRGLYLALDPELVEHLPTHVSCKRIVLFLIKKADRWKPASKTRLMSMSAAWIEDRYVLTYVQHSNPGPLELCPCRDSADEFKATVAKVMHRLPGEFQANDMFVPLGDEVLPKP